MSQTDKARILFLDLETYRTRVPEIVERVTSEALDAEPASNTRKDIKLAWDTEAGRAERVAKKIDKTAVNCEYAEVLCAVILSDIDPEPVAFDGMNASNNPDLTSEQICLTALRDWLAGIGDQKTILVGHNIAKFDLPILINRWRRYRIAPPEWFPTFTGGRWRGRVFDTMERTPSQTPFVSMSDLCEIYGLPPAKSTEWNGTPMDGSRVGAAFEAGEFATILRYCQADVLVTKELYMVMTANHTRGTWIDDDDTILDQLREIETNTILSDAQKAVSQKTIMQRNGLWPV